VTDTILITYSALSDTWNKMRIKDGSTSAVCRLSKKSQAFS